MPALLMTDRQTLLLTTVKKIALDLEITFWNSSSGHCLTKIEIVPALLLGANFPSPYGKLVALRDQRG